MNKKNLLQNSLPLIAAGLGDKLGVKVTVGGSQAWTDGKSINIPSFELVSKKHKDAVLGFLSHEAAHIKFNSFDVDFNSFKSNFHKSIFNIVEDLRIEEAMSNCLIGTRKWIDQIWINRQEEGSRPPIDDSAQPQSIICDWLLFHCRVNYRNQKHLMPYLDAAESAFLNNLGYKLLVELSSINPKLEKLCSTTATAFDAFALSNQILNILDNHDPEDDAQGGDSDDDGQGGDSDDDTQSGDSDGNGQGGDSDDDTQSGDSDGNGQGGDSDDDTQSGDSDGNGQGGDSDDDAQSGDSDGNGQGSDSDDDAQSGDPDGNGQGGDSDSSKQTDSELDKDEVIKAIRQALNSDSIVDDMDDMAAQLDKMSEEQPHVEMVNMPSDTKISLSNLSTNEYLDNLHRVKMTSNALTSKLYGIVQEHVKAKKKTKNRGCKLNNKVLYRPSVADARIFKSKSKAKGVDTVVEIQLDNSYSMTCNNMIRVAKDAQLALALALSKIDGVSVSASAFPSSERNELFNLLSEDEPVKNLAKRHVFLEAQGKSTPSAQAFLYSLKKVLTSRRSKKVIMFITDGEPDCNEEDALRDLVRLAENNGVIVLGIAIGGIARLPGHFHKFFPKALFINNIDELKGKMFKIAKEIIIE